MTVLTMLVLSFIYGYLNGQFGSASVVSTIISSRALGPRLALMLAAFGMTVGPALLGTAVAATIGDEFLRPDTADMPVVIAALVAGIIWSSISLWLKIPVSISQTLVGGLIGAAWAGHGSDVILQTGLVKIAIGFFISPVLGLFVGFIIVHLSYWLSSNATPRLNIWFQRGQILMSLLVAIAFGSNNGQSLMGIIMLGLIAGGMIESFVVPFWVIAFSSAATGLGTLAGGWRLIHTMGGKFYKIRPIHGFSALSASAGVIMSTAIVGWPVSASQVVTSAIVGAGSADRLQKVRWGIVQQILMGWVLTLPASAFVGALTYGLIKGFVR